MRPMATVMKNKTKGQIAVESVIIVGFVLLLMLPLLHTLFSRVISIQDELKVLEARRAVETIATAVSTVGVLGPNGSAVVEITIPNTMTRLTIGKVNGNSHEREIVGTIRTALGEVDIPRMVIYNVTGSLPIRTGRQTIKITYNETGPILVSA